MLSSPAVFAQVEQRLRPPPPPVAPPPPPPQVEPGPLRPSMESRPADERSNRLSLLRFVQDLDAAAVVDPAAEPSGPQSYMDWDDDDEEALPRAQQKVLDKVRNAFDRTEKRKATAAPPNAASQLDDNAAGTSGHEAPRDNQALRKGSVRNALRGIEKRRELDKSKSRKFDELMAPLAMSAQRALAPTRTGANPAQQERSWLNILRKKASARSLKIEVSSESLGKNESDILALSRSSASPSSPRSPPNLSSINGEAPPPIPSVPVQYVLEPSATNDGMNADGGSIAPFLAYEQYAPVVKSPTAKKSPTTPMSGKMHRSKTIESTTTIDTAPTTPSSRDFPSGPDDPFWNNAVTRARETVRREQANERREHKAFAKAEQRFIRGLSRRNEGHYKWVKLTIESLIGKYDEHGWLPKKDPKDFDDDDWKFISEVLAHKDMKKLRDRLFQTPEWIEADRDRQSKHDQAMRTNPTPEYLAAQKAQKDKEHKEYGIRKALGILTAEELEHERLEASPAVGLGIISDLEPVTPVSTRTSESSKATGRSSQSLLTHQLGTRGWQTKPQDCRIAGKPNVDASAAAATLARVSVEQMTDVFNTEDFNPRLSRLASEEVKQYINKKSSSRSEPPTPTPMRFSNNEPHDPQQKEDLGLKDWSTVRPPNIPVRSLEAAEKAAGKSQLLTFSPSLRLPPLGVHPAFRGPQPYDTVQSVTSSRIPRLRGVRSSNPNSTHQKASGETNPGISASTLTDLREASSKPQRPSNSRKQFSTPKVSSEPTASRSLTLPPPTFDLGTSRLPVNASITAPITRRTPTTSDNAESKSDVGLQRGLVRRRGPLGSILDRFERIEGDLAQFPGDKVVSVDAKGDGAEHMGQADISPRVDRNDKPQTDAESVIGENGDGEPLNKNPTVLKVSPQALARFSRIPTIPDASDFSAAMSEDSGISRDATSSSLSSFTPRDRLTAKRSRIPVNAASTSSSDKHSDSSTSLPVLKVDDAHPPPEMPSTNASLASGKWEVVLPKTRERNQQAPRKEAESKTARPALGGIESSRDTTRLDSVFATAEKSPLSASGHGPMTPKHLHKPAGPSRDQNVEQHAPKSRGKLANITRSLSENVVKTPFITASPSERTFSHGHRRRTDSDELDVSFEEVINAWQQSSPATTTQSHSSYSSFNNQEMQVLRFEVGLEPLRDLVPGDAKHPNHRYSWNTKKIMCRRIHNQGVVLPSLPSPTPGQAAHMSEYPAEFFVGSPYTSEPTEPQRCASCESFCCRFAELNAHSKKRTTDIVELTERRRLEVAVATMRIRKPNGAEEWDAFLKCSQCKLNFCPDCIMLCSEEMCQEPVCTDCREGNGLCRIHNII